MSPSRDLLGEEQLAEAMGQLPHWKLLDDRLQRSFRFGDFQRAFEFMTAAAAHAERLDHHPDWSNSYDRVDVILRTHQTNGDRSGITGLDLELARLMDELASA